MVITTSREYSSSLGSENRDYAIGGLRLSPTITSKIQDPFNVYVALQANGSIPIQHLLQQQDPKENPLCK